jgi:hypothetical protein
MNDDSGDSSVYAVIGIIEDYSIDGTWDYISGGRQWLGALANDYVDPLQITNLDPNNNPAPGVSTAGSGFIAITNGKRILCLSEGDRAFNKSATSSPAVLLIAESQ